MLTDDTVREALQRHAETHRVNPSLPRSVAVQARAGRFAAAAAGAALAISLVWGGAVAVGAMGDADAPLAPGSGGSATEQRGPRTVEGAPLLLVTAEGWHMSRADQQLAYATGDATFTDGASVLELTWRTAEEHDGYLQDRLAEAGEERQVTLAGSEATLIRYEGTDDFTALWVDGDLSLELRGGFPDVEAYMAVAGTLRMVDEPTWLAALPEDTVPPSDRRAVVDAMLEDVPVHPGAGLARVRRAKIVSDRYQLGAQVTGAVTCAWIAQWVDAAERGDDRAAQEAVDAMASSKRWRILLEMEPQGGWTRTVWDYADAMGGNGEILGGSTTTIEESYRSAFGCPAKDQA